MKRRTFIQRLAGTGIVLPIAMGFPRMRAFAKSPSGSIFAKLSSATNDNVMVLIRLAGGNDGLNTLVPYTNDAYYTARKAGTADDLSIAANTVIKLSDHDSLGLHPSLAPLRSLYDNGKMTVVQNVGYPNQNLSHFRSTDIWLSGSDWDQYQSSGWYARYLEELYPDYPSVLPDDPFAIEFGSYLSTTLIGDHQNMGVAISSVDYIPGQPDPDPVASTHEGDEEAYVREVIRQSNIFTNSIKNAFTRQTTNRTTYPTSPLATGLAAVARLIAAGMKTQMYILNVGGYDTHTNQLTTHATLHQNLADAVVAFQTDLEAFSLDRRVCMMTISEFGRRVTSNGTGTDHGSAAPLFVFGTGVIGGVVGSDPNLASLEGPGNIRMEHDFRQVYASVLSQWYGATDDQLTPALSKEFAQLPIFEPLSQGGVGAGTTADAGFSLGQNYPNPASGSTVIPLGGIRRDGQFSIYTMDGRRLATSGVASGQTSLELNIGELPTGVYLYELEVDGRKQARQMVVAR